MPAKSNYCKFFKIIFEKISGQNFKINFYSEKYAWPKFYFLPKIFDKGKLLLVPNIFKNKKVCEALLLYLIWKKAHSA